MENQYYHHNYLASVVKLLLLLLLPAVVAAATAAHFETDYVYRYAVRSAATADADLEHTLLDFGLSPAAAAAQPNTPTAGFAAEIEIAPINVTADGDLLCRLGFLGTPSIRVGNNSHDSSGSMHFDAAWFGFVVKLDGTVEKILYEPTELPFVLQFKRGLEPGQFGHEDGTYEVQEDHANGLITWIKQPIIARRGTADGTQVDHENEKKLMKRTEAPHFIHIQVADRVSLKGSASFKLQGLSTRDNENELFIAANGSTTVEFRGKDFASVHVAGPPKEALYGPLHEAPAVHYRTLQDVLHVVKKSLNRLRNSGIAKSNGERLKAFSSARKALESLQSADALIAAEYLTSLKDTDALWVGFDLVGEMCVQVPTLLDYMINKAFADVTDDETAALALKASFKCTAPTLKSVDVLLSVVATHAAPGSNHRIAMETRDHAALLLGYMGRLLREQGQTEESTKVTRVLKEALDNSVAQLARRSADGLDANGDIENEHVDERSINELASTARSATLIRALAQTKDDESINTLKTVIFNNHGSSKTHPVLQAAALSAMGRLTGTAVEDALLTTLSSEQHAEVHEFARRAFGQRKREISVENIAQGAAELYEMYNTNATREGPLTERALRARSIVRNLANFTLAAPPYSWNQRVGADVAGGNMVKRVRDELINRVRLSLSLLNSTFAVEINNVVGASLYFDIGGIYHELDIFEAEMQFMGRIGYNQDVFHNFRMSDTDRLREVFLGWISDIKIQLTTAQTTLKTCWQSVLDAFTTLQSAVATSQSLDWSIYTAALRNATTNPRILSAHDTFLGFEQQIVALQAQAAKTFLNTTRVSEQQVKDAIDQLLAGMEVAVDCPENGVSAILARVNNLAGPTNAIHLAVASLQASFVAGVELSEANFANYKDTFSPHPRAAPLIEMARASIENAEKASGAFNNVISAWTIYEGRVDALKALSEKYRSFLDLNFGPKAHSSFPKTPVSVFPETWADANGNTYQGMRVRTNAQGPVVAPFAGIYQILDSTTIKITVSDITLRTYEILLHDILQRAELANGTTVAKGDLIGQARGSSLTISICGGRFARTCIDPRKYLPRDLPVKTPLTLTANQYSLISMGETVLPLSAIIKRGTANAADPLDIEGKGILARGLSEAPSCTDPRLRQNFMVAGLIPVTFDLQFSSVMSVAARVDVCLYDLAINPALIPHIAVEMSGGILLGTPSATLASLTAQGTIADARIPIGAKLQMATAPADVAKFSMSPTHLDVYDTCPGNALVALADPGFLVDSTAPIVSDSTAFQIPGQPTTSPVIFARFAAMDPESGMDRVTVAVGWSPGDADIVAAREMPRDQGDSWAIPIPPLELLDEKTVYVNVAYQNKQNLTTTTATAVFFDISPAVLNIWNEQTPLSSYDFSSIGVQHPRAALRKNWAYFTEDLSVNLNGTAFTGFSDRLCFYYSIADGSTQNVTRWAIGTGRQSAERANVVNWTFDLAAGTGVSSACAPVNVDHGKLYYLNVETTNSLGYVTVAASHPTMADLTPPPAGKMFFGTSPGSTMGGTIVNSTAFFSISGFRDPESDTAYWHFAIGPSSEMDVRAIQSQPGSWKPFGPWTRYIVNEDYNSYVSLKIENLNMPEGNHTMCVQSTNFVGLVAISCTAGYIIDQTPPTGSARLTINKDYKLTVHFSYADNLSSVQTVMVGLGDGADPNIADYVYLDVGKKPISSYTFQSDLSNMQGQKVYVSFGTGPDKADIIPWTYHQGPQPSYCVDVGPAAAETIKNGVKIYASVRGYNTLKTDFTSAFSDGVTVDLTPPVKFAVNIKTATGSPVINGVAQVSAQWDSSSDPESGLDSYKAALFTKRGGNLTPLRDYAVGDLSMPLKTSAILRGEPSSVVTGDRVLVCVQAISKAGLSITSCSSPVTVDLEAPLLVSRTYRAAEAPLTPFYVIKDQSIDFLWQWTALGGIFNYSCAVYMYVDHRPLKSSTVANATGCYLMDLRSFADGQTYQAIGRVLNQAGTWGKTVFTFVPAFTAPQFARGGTGSTLYGHRDVETSLSIGVAKAWCEFSSAVPIVFWEFAFGTVANRTDLTGGWKESTTPFYEFQIGKDAYYAACRCTNEAGRTSDDQWFSNGTKITPGAHPGAVRDGPQPGVDVSYQSESGVIMATFESFQSSSGLPGVLYSWGLGTTSETADVLPFTSAGLLQPTLDHPGLIYWSGTLLEDGLMYFVHVQAILAGEQLEDFQIVNSTSPGFQVFSKPPTISHKSPETTLTYVRAATTVPFNCTARADSGGLDTIDQRAFVWAKATDLLAFHQSFARTTEKTVVTSLQLDSALDGISIATSCNASASSVGVVSPIQNSFFINDGSPPIGVANLSCYPAWIAKNGHGAKCTWTDSRDDQSGIATYAVTVGTSAGGAEIALNTQPLGNEYALDASLLTPGTKKLFLSVIATNAVGLQAVTTTSVSVEWAGPAQGQGLVRVLEPIGSVRLPSKDHAATSTSVVTAKSATCLATTNTVRAAWDDVFIATPAGIAGYDVSVSASFINTAGNTEELTLAPWAPVGIATSHTVVLNSSLVANTSVFVLVRAWTGAGLSYVSRSSTVGVVTGYRSSGGLGRPQGLSVAQQLLPNAKPQTYAIQSHFWRASWNFASVCPITIFKWRVIDVTDSVNSTVYGPVFTHLNSGLALNLELVPNRTYATVVVAYNGLGISSSPMTSVGTTIIWTPAAARRVFDGPVPGVQTDVFVNLTYAAASWESFSTPTCSAQGYQWAVGNSTSSYTDQTSVLPFMDVKTGNNASFLLSRPLKRNKMYFTTVRATSCTGDILYGFSRGFQISRRPPPRAGPVRLLGTRGTASGVKSQSSSRTVRFAWSGFGSVWSKLHFEVALGTSSNSSNELLQDFTLVDLYDTDDEAVYTFTNLNLDVSSDSRRIQYYAHVRVTDAAFQVAVNTTEPFIVDQTPPSTKGVRLRNEAVNDITWLNNTKRVTFSVDGVFDLESDIADISYKVLLAVKEKAADPDSTWRSLGNISVSLINGTTGFVDAYIDLIPGVPYYILVKVTNGASLATIRSSRQFAADVQAPVAGSLVVGTDFSNNLRYLTSTSQLDFLYAEGFTPSDTECSSVTQNFVGNNTMLTAPGSAWTIPSSGCAIFAANGLIMRLTFAGSSCEIAGAFFAAGTAFSASLRPSAAANSFTSFAVTDSEAPIDGVIYTSDRIITNTAFSFSAIGFEISGGATPTVSIWRVDRGDKARTTIGMFLADSSALLRILTFTIAIRESDVFLTITDPSNGRLLAQQTLSRMNGNNFWVDQTPRVSPRIRLWTPGNLAAEPSLLLMNITYPLPSQQPCSFHRVWSSLVSGLNKAEIGLGTQKGQVDIRDYKTFIPTNWTRPGCLGDQCFMSTPVTANPDGVVLRGTSLTGLSLVAFDWVYKWCDLGPLEGGCSKAASCTLRPYDPATGNSTFSCTCGQGWEGQSGVGLRGCTSIAQCEQAASTGISLCAPSAVCRNAPGMFLCGCPKGFEGDPYDVNSVGCKDVDECAVATASHQDICGSGGVCLNTLGDYECICRPGFKQIDSHTCEDINECSSNPCSGSYKCVNEVGSYKCVLQCPVGTVLSRTGNGCLPPSPLCSAAVPLLLGKTATASLNGSHILLDPQFGNRGRFGLWFYVENPVQSSISIILSNSGHFTWMTVQIMDSCSSASTPFICFPDFTCSFSSSYPSIYILVSATTPNSYAVTALAPKNVFCNTPCSNGGTCVGYNICRCDPNSAWTGPTCATPRYSMQIPVAKNNFTCLDASISGANAANGFCAPGPAPGSAATAALFSFQTCFALPGISPIEPARVSIVFPNTLLNFNLTIQDCANSCRDAGFPLFMFTTLAQWRTPYWSELYRATSQCLCMPSLPPGATQTPLTSCSKDDTSGGIGIGMLANVIAGPVFWVQPYATWCPASEVLSQSTNLTQSFNAPQACQSRRTVSGNTCRFPFFVRGEIYTDCTSVDDVRPWCFTDSLNTVQEYCLSTDLDFCSHPSSTCGEHATCVNSGTGPSCSCDSGFAMQNGVCLDVNECLLFDPCSTFAKCYNTNGGFYCHCDNLSGFFATADNYTCSYDPDSALLLQGLTPKPRMPPLIKAPRTYYATLRLTNRANISATSWSTPIIIDQDPPALQVFRLSYQGVVIEALRNTRMEAEWRFHSNISGVVFYQFGLGSAPGLTDMIPNQRTRSDRVTITPPSTPSGRVYFSLTAYSGSMVNSTQIIPLDLSVSGPLTGTVEYAQFGQFLKWTNFTDSVGVSNYYIGIGTQLGGNDLMNWTLTGNGAQTTGPFLLPLCSGPGCATSPLPAQLASVATPVWFSIRASNRAGFWSAPANASFPTILLGSDAAILKANVAIASTSGFEDTAAVATISGSPAAGATAIAAMISVGVYQYDISKLTSITLVRPKTLLVLRSGSMYASYGRVHMHIASVNADGSLSPKLPVTVSNASIALSALRTDGKPAIYYQGQMNSSSFIPAAWKAVTATNTSVINANVMWKPTAPGIYGLYYNWTFPSFMDTNGDALADVLHVMHSNTPDTRDYGWGILGSLLSSPVAARQYVALLSPDYRSTATFASTFSRNEIVVAVGDFDADGKMDYVLSTQGYPLYADWGLVSYKIVFNASTTPSVTLTPPATSIYAQYFERHYLLGFIDVDDDTFLGANYSAGCGNPFFISLQPFLPYTILGIGSWSPGGIGIMKSYRRPDSTLAFAIVNLQIVKSTTGAITSISTQPLIYLSMSINVERWQVWLARVPGDLNGDNIADMVLQCSSWAGICGPSRNLFSYTIVWYLNSSGKVISTGVLATPPGSRLALGTEIYR
ncbi:hypothetical protein HDU86_004057 [Geranomyces michiganensis]|nr:hypothetical protein HDU86_004057 [Geranomyces michiganensis]